MGLPGYLPPQLCSSLNQMHRMAAMPCHPADATALLETTSLSLPDTLDLLPASSRSMVWGGRLTWYLQVGTLGAAGCQGS